MIQNGFPSSRYIRKKDICVQIPIPAGFNDYLNTLNKKVRQNLRNSFTRLKTDRRTFEVQTYVNQAIPSDILLQLFKIYWKRLSDKKLAIGVKRFLPVPLRMQLNPTIIALKILSNVFCSIIYIDKAIAGFCAGLTSHNEKSFYLSGHQRRFFAF